MSDKIWISESTIGYVEIDDDETWDAAVLHSTEDRPTMLNVDYVIETLEDQEEELSPGEQRLLAICQEAQSKGIPDLSAY